MFLWLSIVNSLPFDWLVRRIVTTTVNYFVLRSLRLPALEIGNPSGRRLIRIARQLAILDTCGTTSFELCWRIANLRAEADMLVADAYGCTEGDVRLMLEDFPLLDRGEPKLPEDRRSSVTADLLLSKWTRRRSRRQIPEAERCQRARGLGAIAYLSSEFSTSARGTREASHE